MLEQQFPIDDSYKILILHCVKILNIHHHFPFRFPTKSLILEVAMESLLIGKVSDSFDPNDFIEANQFFLQSTHSIFLHHV